MLNMILLPFKIAKFALCLSVLAILVSPFYFFTAETYHGLKHAQARTAAVRAAHSASLAHARRLR